MQNFNSLISPGHTNAPYHTSCHQNTLEKNWPSGNRETLNMFMGLSEKTHTSYKPSFLRPTAPFPNHDKKKEGGLSGKRWNAFRLSLKVKRRHLNNNVVRLRFSLSIRFTSSLDCYSRVQFKHHLSREPSLFLPEYLIHAASHCLLLARNAERWIERHPSERGQAILGLVCGRKVSSDGTSLHFKITTVTGGCGLSYTETGKHDWRWQIDILGFLMSWCLTNLFLDFTRTLSTLRVKLSLNAGQGNSTEHSNLQPVPLSKEHVSSLTLPLESMDGGGNV